MAPLLRELKRIIRYRLSDIRDVAGYDLAAMKMVSRVANDRKKAFAIQDNQPTTDIWAGLGLGSDAAAALEGRPSRR